MHEISSGLSGVLPRPHRRLLGSAGYSGWASLWTAPGAAEGAGVYVYFSYPPGENLDTGNADPPYALGSVAPLERPAGSAGRHPTRRAYN
ncbi:hypothetical protein KM043_017404 [Ampulex compressa]|nr:hypothetical protein KM043_017404 [Ampulex compressa]